MDKDSEMTIDMTELWLFNWISDKNVTRKNEPVKIAIVMK